MKSNSRHQCLIYSGAPSHKLPALASVMNQMIADGYRCLYLNSPAMVAGMRSCLAATGMDVAAEIADTRIIFSSETTSEGDDFDIEAMLQKLEETLDVALKDGYKGLWASGDMTWELGSEKNFEKLVDYECRLEALFHRRKELHGICQYHYDTLPGKAMRNGLLTHPALFINETLSYLNPLYFKSESLSEKDADNPALDKKIAELCRLDSHSAPE